MDEQEIRTLLSAVRLGACSEDEFIHRLKSLPFEDLGFAKLDHHRHLRTGFPEVIFAQGKTAEQVAILFSRLKERNPIVMATRVTPEQVEATLAMVPECIHHPTARLLTWHRGGRTFRHDGDPLITIAAAGTADLPVAEEAAITAETAGWPVDRLYDVGVAGVHRLLANADRLMRAKVIVVVAGMEGALASVVGGLVKAPIIAVPTSVGYGASFGGLAALLSMLNSCASGVVVVNIDNGYGAGYYAALLAEMAHGQNSLLPAGEEACQAKKI
ncbi:MAG: nickel pincer cofactor biosynthesis protein LarB [Armatimonadota bacterium]